MQCVLQMLQCILLMASSDTLYYADYIVLFIDRPTYDEWENSSLTFED